jgi:type II secretory pathway pseudopilin PulG
VVANRTKWGVVGSLVLGVAVAASVGVVLLKGQIVDTKEMDARARLKTLRQALDLYKAQHGAYPTTDQSLTVLIDRPGSRGYLTSPHALLDPWGAGYIYRSLDVQHGGRDDDIVEPLAP